MSIFDPKQTPADGKRDGDVERDDTPLLTRFARDARQRWRPRQKSGAMPPIGEPRPAPDDGRPFEDDGGL